MQDLSAGGAGLLTTTEIPPGTDIERLHFELPQDDDSEPQPIEVAARVARCVQQPGLGGEAEFLIGVHFVDISRELFDRIQQFVFQRLRSNQTNRVKIEQAIAIRFDRFDNFVDEVSVNLSTNGMFIRTRDPRPPGSVFNFQFQLGEDFSLIEGRAEVVWRRRFSEGSDKPAGMGVKFVNLDVSSQQLIDRLIVQRHEAENAAEAAGQPTQAAVEPAEPEQEAAEAAHQESESQPDELAGQLHGLEGDPARAGGRTGELQGLFDGSVSDEDVERLTNECNELRTALDDLQEELDKARGEASELQSQLEERTSEEEVQRLSVQHSELLATNVKLLSDLDRANEAADEMRIQLADRAAEQEVERLAGERADAQAAYDELQTAHDGLQADLARAGGEVEELRAQREVLERTRDRLLADLDRADTEADEMRRQLGDHERAEADLEAEIDRLQRPREATIVQLQTDHSAALQKTVPEVQEAAAAELAAAREESERRPGEFASAEQADSTIESEMQHVGDQARPSSPIRALLGSLAARLWPAGEKTVPTAETMDTPVAAEPEPEPAPGTGPHPTTAEQAVHDWVAAWSDQRADDYLESYADSFQPPDGESRSSWAANRRQEIEQPQSINVSVEAASIVELSNDRVSVSFDQTYSSDTFTDRARKTLLLVWQDGAWRIAEERTVE